MHVEDIRDYALAKPGVTEGFPFGEGVLVFKVMGKMFLLMSLDSSPLRVNLKMNPEFVEQYREKYHDVLPGYHMNKKLWNSVLFDTGGIPAKELKWMIDHSYDEVVLKLSKKDQLSLTSLRLKE
jgi:predicted DNA-binding protein (MmcQ/YjbR family)